VTAYFQVKIKAVDASLASRASEQSVASFDSFDQTVSTDTAATMPGPYSMDCMDSEPALRVPPT